MRKIYTVTAKYFSLAIEQFLPSLKGLALKITNVRQKTDINDLIEMYQDVKSKIDQLGMNCSDPNRIFPGEEREVRIDLDDDLLKHFSRLTQRLLISWKEELVKLESKSYKSESTLYRIHELESLVPPLEAISKRKDYIVGQFADEGPIKFPGEDSVQVDKKELPLFEGSVIFPSELILRLPSDVARLCEELNFVHKNQKPYAGILLLRRILPLAIVRKFQQLDRECEIQNAHGEHFDTGALLRALENVLNNPRVYSEIISYKLLVDLSQHSYSLNIYMSDTESAAVKTRVLLGHLFP